MSSSVTGATKGVGLQRQGVQGLEMMPKKVFVKQMACVLFGSGARISAEKSRFERTEGSGVSQAGLGVLTGQLDYSTDCV